MMTIATWVNRHDAVKLLIITLLMIPVMRLSLTVSGDLDPFVYVGFLGWCCAVWGPTGWGAGSES